MMTMQYHEVRFYSYVIIIIPVHLRPTAGHSSIFRMRGLVPYFPRGVFILLQKFYKFFVKMLIKRFLLKTYCRRKAKGAWLHSSLHLILFRLLLTVLFVLSRYKDIYSLTIFCFIHYSLTNTPVTKASGDAIPAKRVIHAELKTENVH